MGGHKGGQTHQGHLTQRTMTLANKVVLGAILECDKAKFTKKFTICTLDGIEAILGNTFLDVYCVHVLKGRFKLKVIARLTNRFVGLKVEYQVNLTKVGR
jgi:hypothetical protein